MAMNCAPLGPSGPIPQPIQDQFGERVRQHGHRLISFIADELHEPPPAVSITLVRLEFPGCPVNWVWFVGSPDAPTEKAVLRFFQSDAGKTTLAADGPDAVEFKLASTFVRLSPGDTEELAIQLQQRVAAPAPAYLADQEVEILSESLPHPTAVATGMTGWLQVSPSLQLSELAF